MDLKHELLYRPPDTAALMMGAVKAEPEGHGAPSTSGRGGPFSGVGGKRPRTDEWMAASASPAAAPLTPSPGPPNHSYTHQSNGYSSPMSSESYDPYSPNGKNGESLNLSLIQCNSTVYYCTVYC